MWTVGVYGLRKNVCHRTDKYEFAKHEVDSKIHTKMQTSHESNTDQVTDIVANRFLRKKNVGEKTGMGTERMMTTRGVLVSFFSKLLSGESHLDML